MGNKSIFQRLKNNFFSGKPQWFCAYLFLKTTESSFAACRVNTQNVSINHPFLSYMWVILSFMNSWTLWLATGASNCPSSHPLFQENSFCLLPLLWNALYILFLFYFHLLLSPLILWAIRFHFCLVPISSFHLPLGPPILCFPKVFIRLHNLPPSSAVSPSSSLLLSFLFLWGICLSWCQAHLR